MGLTKWGKIKKGQVIGLKKVLRLRYKLGRHEYWDVKCLECGTVVMQHISTIKKGRHCDICRRRMKPYVNTAVLKPY